MAYSNLSNYLSNSLKDQNKPITEGFFGKDGLFGSIFGFAGMFLGFGNLSSDDDPITKELARQAAESEKNAEERLKKLEASREAAYIAKLKAKHENRERQMTLANDQRVNAYNATKAKLEKEAANAKTAKTMKTASQMAAFDEMVNGEFDRTDGIDDDAARMMNLMSALIYDDDGNPRDTDQIKEYIKEGDGAEFFKEFQKITNTHKKDVDEALKVLQNKKINIIGKANDIEGRLADAERQHNIAKEAQEKLEGYEKSAATYNDLKNKYNGAKEEADAAQDKLDKFTGKLGKTKDGWFSKDDSSTKLVLDKDGNITASSKFDVQKYLAEEIKGFLNDPNNIKKETDETTGQQSDTVDKEKLKTFLTRMGVDYDKFNAAVGETELAELRTDADALDNTLETAIKKTCSKDGNGNEVDDSLTENIKNNIVENAQAEYKTLKSKSEQAQNKLKQSPDPDSPTFETDYEATGGADAKEVVAQVKAYAQIPEDDKTILNDKDLLTAKKKEINTAYEKTKTQLSEHQHAVEVRKDRVKDAKSKLKSQSTFKELQHQINTLTQGANDGEVIKEIDGKQVQGYYSDTEKDSTGNPKFIERPDTNDEVKTKEYEKGLKNKLLVGDISNGIDTSKIEKEGDDYFKVNKDGEKVKIEKDEAARILAEQECARKNKSLQSKHKEDAIKQVKTILQGDMSNLTNEQKEILTLALKDPDKLCKGVDLTGNKSLNDFRTVIKDNEDKIPSDIKDAAGYNDDDGNGKDEYGNDDEYDDVDNEGDDTEEGDDEEVADTDDEKEYNDTEVKTDETGEKLVLKNPSKVWRRRKNKRTGKTTKSYYNGKRDDNGNWVTISQEEYREKLKRYRARKNKNKKPNPESQTTTPLDGGESRYEDFKNYLFERFGS